jgi:hypothetical protein
MSGITGGFHEFRQLLIGLNQRFQYLMPDGLAEQPMASGFTRCN